MSRTSRIIARWLAAPEFTDSHGRPRPLARTADQSGGEPSFEQLVESITRDVRARAVLDEWLDRRLVVIDAEGRIVLAELAFVPQVGAEEQLYYFGRNLHDHVAAAVANVLGEGPRFLERAVHYDGLSDELAKTLEQRSREIALAALHEANREAHAACAVDFGGDQRWTMGILYLSRAGDFPRATGFAGSAGRRGALSKPPRLSRRSLLALLAGFPAFAAAPRGLAGPRDQGIGGTGASISPAEDEGDRGIGGTGVIGTIRRFGSIVVNGMRISYPEDASVRIDGAAATPASLKIGQVVRVVALETDNQFSTRTINVTSEVVGRVEKVGPKSLTVLGQNVSLADLPKTQRRFGFGSNVAVSGLRRPDGIIVASLVETREPGLEQVAGPVAIAGDGALTVGDLKLTGVDPAFIGQRVVLQGQLVDGSFNVAHAKAESALLGGNLKALSIEAYVERGADGLHLGSGLPVSGSGDFGLPLNRTVRAVLETSPGGGGQWRVDSVRLNGAGAPGLPGGSPSPQLPGGGGSLGGPDFSRGAVRTARRRAARPTRLIRRPGWLWPARPRRVWPARRRARTYRIWTARIWTARRPRRSGRRWPRQFWRTATLGSDGLLRRLRRRRDRDGADRIGGGTIDDLRAYGQIDQRTVLPVGNSVDARRLEKDAGLLGERFFIIRQFGKIDGNRACLTAGNGEIRRILVEAKRLPPSACAGLRDIAGDARYFRIVKARHAYLVVGREQVERRADATQVLGRREGRHC